MTVTRGCWGMGIGAAGLAMSITMAQAEDIKLRIASGHAPATPYVQLMANFFVPEVSKRVAAKTSHKVEFIEGYGGSMVKVADVLEGVQSGIIDVGGYSFAFEPSNLPLHAFQVMVPFGTMSARDSLKIARAVYAKVPYMTQVFEDKFNQKLVGLVGDNGYNILTQFEWKTIADLKNKKVAGAGLNLKWLEFAGAVPVQTSAPEVYNNLQTGVFQGILIFPSYAVSLKWYEVAKHYTLVEFGAVTWQALTINKAKFAKLPKEVQDIILEVGREYEATTAKNSDEDYPKQLDQLKAAGATVKSVSPEVRAAWAKSLAKWPQQKADELDAKGLPASQVLRLAIEEAEAIGYKWPVRYEIKTPANTKRALLNFKWVVGHED